MMAQTQMDELEEDIPITPTLSAGAATPTTTMSTAAAAGSLDAVTKAMSMAQAVTLQRHFAAAVLPPSGKDENQNTTAAATMHTGLAALVTTPGQVMTSIVTPQGQTVTSMMAAQRVITSTTGGMNVIQHHLGYAKQP